MSRPAGGSAHRGGTIWIDLTDLFHEFRLAGHVTGVSRMALNIADQLIAAPGDAFAAARILFWRPGAWFPSTVDVAASESLATFFPQLARLYREAGCMILPSSAAASPLERSIASGFMRSVRYTLYPADSGVMLFEYWAKTQGIAVEPALLREGDSLFLPGSFWLERHTPRLLALARTAGASVTAFIHDMLLLTHPEWRPGALAGQFRRGCETILPKCQAVVCNSQHTAAELRRCIRLPASLPIATCRFGDQPPSGGEAQVADLPPELVGKRYVLCVATLLPRKNHRLLVQAWRELSRRTGEATPYLVFVGGGAPDRELAELLKCERAESGRIVQLGGVDDAMLETLYRHAWLTAFPSLAEGYGIPVAEALARGKVCLAAPVEGVSEAGAGFVDVIDPNDPERVVARVAGYLADPTSLVAREAEIRRGYRSTSWAETAGTVRAVLERAAARG